MDHCIASEKVMTASTKYQPSANLNCNSWMKTGNKGLKRLLATRRVHQRGRRIMQGNTIYWAFQSISSVMS